MRRIWLVAAALALLALGSAAYLLVAPRSNILAPPRASNGVEYVLHVYVPPACRDGDCRALYVLDGLAWLPTFARLDDELSRRREIQPLILVGIAYRDAPNTRDLRKHDFTPSFDRTPGETGGADAFLQILRDDLIPYAESHLPIASDERGLAGHSYAGLFAAYTLTQAPDLFDHYLIMSPALYFDHGKIYDLAVAPAENTRSIFLAADTLRGDSRSTIANEVLRYKDLLLEQPRLRVSHALIAGETHSGMAPPAARRGLIALYGLEPER